MGKSSAPDPDPAIGEAAIAQAELGREWLGFAKDQFGLSNQRQVGVDALAKRVTESQLAAQDKAAQWADEDRARHRTIFQPMQDQFIQKANNWDSAERQQSLAAEAKADVLTNADLQRQQRARQLGAMGVMPGSGRFQAGETAAGTQTALAGAAAQNNARTMARKEGMALRGEAINLGNGLPTQASGALGLGVGAGSSAMGTTATANGIRNQSMGIMGQGYGGAMNGLQGQISGLNTQFQQQMQTYNAQQQSIGSMASGIGSLAGMLMFSDEDVKTDKKSVRGILDAVRNMPVEAWRYKDGAGDGGEHIGTYAQDFKRETGLGDGRSINIIDAIGVTMGAVKELADKVDGMQTKDNKRGYDRRAAA